MIGLWKRTAKAEIFPLMVPKARNISALRKPKCAPQNNVGDETHEPHSDQVKNTFHVRWSETPHSSTGMGRFPLKSLRIPGLQHKPVQYMLNLNAKRFTPRIPHCKKISAKTSGRGRPEGQTQRQTDQWRKASPITLKLLLIWWPCLMTSEIFQNTAQT